MKIDPRYYPAIILITFVVFVLIGFLLGFRPHHNEAEHGLLLLWSSLI